MKHYQIEIFEIFEKNNAKPIYKFPPFSYGSGFFPKKYIYYAFITKKMF
jgi:hypothetical protein